MPYQYLLDTNIVSHLIRNPGGIVAERIAQVGADAICIDVIVASEIKFGAVKRNSARLSTQVRTILACLPVLALEPPLDDHYADIRLFLESNGILIRPNDLWIAAHARVLDLTLVSDNLDEFLRVPGLRVENWLDSGGEKKR